MGLQTLDTSVADAVLKELYDGQLPENMVYQDNPFLAMVPKKTDFGGRNYPTPVQFGVSQGRSATFSTAQTNQTANQYVEFLLTRAKDYSIATISNEMLLAASSDREAFIRSAQALVDGAITSCTNSLASSLFRSGTGSIGQISIISTGVITLSDPDSVAQFEKNMVLGSSATDGAAIRTGGTPLGYVIARNAVLGTITVSNSFGGAAATPTGWTAGDYLSVQGDLNAKIKGLEAWLPTSISATSFFGVDRTPDTRLWGLYKDCSAQTIEEALIDSSNILAREGGNPDVAIVNFTSYGALEKSLGSKVQYVDLKGPAEISFRGIQISGAKKQIKVFPDRNCQQYTAWLLQLNTWTLATLGEAPMILRYGSNDEMLRVYNADEAELRVAYYGNLGCSAPGYNARVLLSA